MTKPKKRMRRSLVALLFLVTFASHGCGGGGSKPLTGCYVNGTYYPNGNAPNDQCVCPVIGPCSITFPIPAGIALAAAHQVRTATLLPNGQILLTGGRDAKGIVLDTAELYDSTTRTSTTLRATLTTPRVGHAATRLLNDQVLLTGGRDGSGIALNTAEIYDPVLQSFTALAATMTTPRAGHTGVLLLDGKVLLSGGRGGPGTDPKTEEFYDPGSRTSTPAGHELQEGNKP